MRISGAEELRQWLLLLAYTHECSLHEQGHSGVAAHDSLGGL
jgi:hypothetical protein